MLRKSILVISDQHAPYHHIDTLDFLAAIKKKYKPKNSYHSSGYVQSNDKISQLEKESNELTDEDANDEVE